MRTYINSGVVDARGSKNVFGAILSNGEEILTSEYLCKENEPVVFDLNYVYKFKRAVNVMNLNQVLENLGYLMLYSSTKHSEESQNRLLDLKMKANILLEKEYKEENLSFSAKKALSALRNTF